MKKNKHFWQALKETACECNCCHNIFDSELYIDNDYKYRIVGAYTRELATCPHCQQKQHVNVRLTEKDNGNG